MKRIIGPVGLSTVSLWVLPSYTPKGYTIALEPLDDPKLLVSVSATIRLNRPFNALPITLPGEAWPVDPDRRLRGKTSMITPGDTAAALEDLAVVGGEVARVSEAGHDQLHEAPGATVVGDAVHVAEDGDLFPWHCAESVREARVLLLKCLRR